MVTSLAAVWIEIGYTPIVCHTDLVTSLAEVWIEIGMEELVTEEQ